MFYDRDQPTRRMPAQDLGALAASLRSVPGLDEALILTPGDSPIRHPFPDDEAPPLLAVQLNFPAIEPLEAALTPDGPLHMLAGRRALTGLQGTTANQQAMLTRRFPVPDAQFAADAQPCSYLVHYPGAAEDLPAWLAHYLHHHPALMAHFPGVRQIEIYTRLDWWGQLPLPRADFMQRNKLVFDSPAALSEALLSPALSGMRADYHQFPPFTGGNVHYPLLTQTVRP
jgi:hypothetical protein